MDCSSSTPPPESSEIRGTEVSNPMAALREENDMLKQQLAEVVAVASKNERIWRHFTEIERILFRTRDLSRLTMELLSEIKARFQPEYAILFLCHPDLLELFFPDVSEAGEPVDDGAWILTCPAETGQSLFGEPPKPFLLSADNIACIDGLLPEAISSIRSAVVTPLWIHHILFGALFLGSSDADRYHPEDGTDLLEQLGAKIALSMDNCLSYERVKDFSIQDPVTGLMNFFQIHTVLEREFRRVRRTEDPLSVLIIDLNFVHEINDDFDSGNDVLKHAADLLRTVLPEKESYLGRYGSDEFLLVLPGVEEEEAREVAPFLAQTILKSPYKHRNTAILIQSLIGVGTLTEEMERPRDLVDAAYAELCRLRTVRMESGV